MRLNRDGTPDYCLGRVVAWSECDEGFEKWWPVVHKEQEAMLETVECRGVWHGPFNDDTHNTYWVMDAETYAEWLEKNH